MRRLLAQGEIRVETQWLQASLESGGGAKASSSWPRVPSLATKVRQLSLRKVPLFQSTASRK